MNAEENYSIIPRSDPSAETMMNLPAVPAEFKGEDVGFDPARDLVVPRLQLLQAMSDACQTESGIPEARPGLFLNGLTKAVYKPPLELVIVRASKSAHFFGDEKAGAPACHSTDLVSGSTYGPCESCSFNWKKWTNGEPPKCAETINFLLLPPGSTAPLIFAAMKTALRPAREFWNQRRAMMDLKNWWDRAALFQVRSVKNDKGTYYVPVLGFNARGTDEPTKRLAYSIYRWSEGKTILAEEENGNGG